MYDRILTGKGKVGHITMENVFTGQLGLVLLPDAATRAAATEVGQAIKPNELNVGGKHEPHLTLYHSKLSAVPVRTVDTALAELKKTLPLKAVFTELASFGGKFMFWDAERSGALLGLHKQALKLAAFYDAAGTQQAEREALQLSGEQSENVRRYGHPLVGALWRPHITAGYSAGGYPDESRGQPYVGVFAGAAFVEVGEFGTIKNILAQL